MSKSQWGKGPEPNPFTNPKPKPPPNNWTDKKEGPQKITFAGYKQDSAFKTETELAPPDDIPPQPVPPQKKITWAGNSLEAMERFRQKLCKDGDDATSKAHLEEWYKRQHHLDALPPTKQDIATQPDVSTPPDDAPPQPTPPQPKLNLKRAPPIPKKPPLDFGLIHYVPSHASLDEVFIKLQSIPDTKGRLRTILNNTICEIANLSPIAVRSRLQFILQDIESLPI
jgi:hypothetical protein